MLNWHLKKKTQSDRLQWSPPTSPLLAMADTDPRKGVHRSPLQLLQYK
jgi:hypothetical protein